MLSRAKNSTQFRKWVCNTVLPSIRKTGSFSIAPQQPALPDFSNPAAAARAWADKFEEAEKAKALASGLDKSLTGSQRNNAKLTREIKAVREDNRELQLRLQGQSGEMSVLQYLHNVLGRRDIKDFPSKVTKVLRETAEAEGIQVKSCILGRDKFPSKVFPIDFLQSKQDLLKQLLPQLDA